MLVKTFSGIKSFAISAVANIANIYSNEYFCPVGYTKPAQIKRGTDTKTVPASKIKGPRAGNKPNTLMKGQEAYIIPHSQIFPTT